MVNTQATHDARLCQLEQHYSHEMCAEAVLTIRVTNIYKSVAVLDTGAMCSASNNPGEILDISPSTVLLKPTVDAPQYMNEIRMSVPTYDIVGDSIYTFRCVRPSCCSPWFVINFGFTSFR